MKRSLMSSVADGLNEESNPDSERRRPSRFAERSNRLAHVTSEDRIEKTLFKVDPKRCRLWEYHNRRYDLLDERNCADLIEGLKKQGEQEFPAVVRRIHDDPLYDYEVICGARRHWAVSWLRDHNFQKYKYLIEVRDLGDEEAFRLADAENRDRVDISDFERASDYLQALDRYYEGKQKGMATRLEVSEAWLSRYLDLARLPAEIIAAFGAVTHIRVQHARELKPLLREAKSRSRVLERARELQSQQAADEVKPENIVKSLKEAAESKAVRKLGQAQLATYQSSAGAKFLTVHRRRRGELIFKIRSSDAANRDELLAACKEALDTFGD
ncbi:MAG: ParB/RepB/Spo0J family partition protein [Geminicoccaceae bacterium]